MSDNLKYKRLKQNKIVSKKLLGKVFDNPHLKLIDFNIGEVSNEYNHNSDDTYMIRMRQSITLVSEVYVTYQGVKSFTNTRRNITYSLSEVAFMCKDWAYEQGYIVEPSKYNGKGRADVCRTGVAAIEENETFKCETELEAIFAACEWARIQIKNKKKV